MEEKKYRIVWKPLTVIVDREKEGWEKCDQGIEMATNLVQTHMRSMIHWNMSSSEALEEISEFLRKLLKLVKEDLAEIDQKT